MRSPRIRAFGTRQLWMNRSAIAAALLLRWFAGWSSAAGGGVVVEAAAVSSSLSSSYTSSSSTTTTTTRPSGMPSTTATTADCDSKIQDVRTWFDPFGKCGSDPSCACGYDERGRVHAECDDRQRQCSSSDPRVCGYQSAKGTYADDGTAEYLYVWEYDGGRRSQTTLRYYRWHDGSCTFTIADRRGAELPCATCESVVCPDGRNSFYIDCSNYEVGAVAAGCSKALDRPGNVLHGFGVTDGSCLPGGIAVAAAEGGHDGVTGVLEVVLAIALIALARLLVPWVRKRLPPNQRKRTPPPPRVVLDRRRMGNANSNGKDKNGSKVKRS